MKEFTTNTVEVPSRTEPSLPPVQEERRPKRWLWVVVVLLVIGTAAFIWRRSDNPSAAATGRPGGRGGMGRGGPMTIPVVAAKAQTGDLGVELTGLGNVTPIHTVTVKTRVDGELTKVLYTEGQTVHQGDLLAEIDPRPFEVQLMQAQGQLARDQASLDNARIDLQRYEELVPHNAVPEQQVATQKALVAQFEGAVKSDEGQVASAKLNLTYCRITAPVTGRVGLRLVDPGNIVHAADANGLLVITQMQPISVIFTIAEDQVPSVMQKVSAGQKLSATAFSRDNQVKLGEGFLSTIDNQIDPTTGTLRLRATFDNHANSLFPNQFVNVRLLVERKRGITTVPTAVIQRNSTNTYVYLVKPDSTVTIRNINIGTTEGDQTEVTSGLSPGDVVVMTGVDKLQEGTKVVAHLAGQKGQKEAE